MKAHEVRDALNAAGGHADNNFGSLFRKENINMFSKKKPVNYPELFCNDDYYPNWWKGEDNSCGIAFGKFMSIDEVMDANWEYVPLKDGYPRRLGDFRNYDTEAQPVIATRIAEGEKKEVDFNDGIWEFYPDIPPSSDTQLSVSDLSAVLSNPTLYICAAVRIMGAWDITIGDDIMAEECKVTVNFGTTTNWIGEHRVVLCLTDGNEAYFPLPQDNDNVASFKLNVVYRLPYVIEFLGISNSLNGEYTDLSLYGSQETGYPATNEVYFKCKVIKQTTSATYVYTSELTGMSENFEGGTTEQSLVSCMYDSSKKLVEQVDLRYMSVGDETIVYFNWDGYKYTTDAQLDYIYADFFIYNSDGAHVGVGGFIMSK